MAKLIKKGVALADLTGAHATLLKRKSYQNMTSNNVNHSNDYIARTVILSKGNARLMQATIKMD